MLQSLRRNGICACISVQLSCNSEIPSGSASLWHGHGLQSIAPSNDGDNGALLPQDPNVQLDPLIGNVSPALANATTHPTSAFSDAISPVASPEEGSEAGVSGKKSLTCSICYRLFARRSRAEACENMHQHKRPYACRNACGASNWYVYLVYPHAAVMRTLSSSASFPSKAGLSRHSRSVKTRNRACTQWYVKRLD